MTISFHSAEDIGIEFKTRIEQLTVALGAETDIGKTVRLGQRHVDDTMIPYTAVIEEPDEPAREYRNTEYQVTQPFTFFAYLACDPTNPNTAGHKAIRDLKRALFRTNGKADRTLGGKVRTLRYMGREFGPRKDGAAFLVVAMQVEVTYVEDVSTP
jgi:hypothetical protein